MLAHTRHLAPDALAIRFDIGTLRPAVRGEDGILRAEAYLARTGVQVYHNADGSPRREYRPRAEVFDAASMRTFAMVPVTDDHPPEMLTSRNAKKYAVGAVGEQIRQDGDKIAAPIMVYDEDTIRKMQGGKVAVSCGYQCDLVHKPGTSPEGDKYDAIQTNIRGNHVAIVDYGRAGTGVKVRMDAVSRFGGEDVAWHLDDELSSEERGNLKDQTFAYPEERKLPLNDEEHVRAAMGGHGFSAVEWNPEHKGAKRRAFNAIVKKAKELGVDSSGFQAKYKNRLDQDSPTRSEKMPKPQIKKDENHEELLEAAADQVAKATKRADEAEAALAAETRRADEAEGELETLKTRVKQLEENRVDEAEPARLKGEIKILQTRLASAEKARVDAESPDRLRKAVRARVAIEKAAAAILPDTGRVDTLNDRELMCVIVEKLHGVTIEASRSDDYVRARFDSAVEQFSKGAEALGSLRSLVPSLREGDKQRADTKSARDQMIERQQTAWQKPLNGHGGQAGG